MRILVGIACALILLMLGGFAALFVTALLWTSLGPIGTFVVYGIIITLVVAVRYAETERIVRICKELGITREEYNNKVKRAEEEAAVAEWQSLSKGEKISRRLKQRYWETWSIK